MKLEFTDPSINYFLTGDYHLDHANIIRFCNRPFTHVKEMDTCLLEMCNQHVREQDVLFYLGDWCFWRGNSYINRATRFREALQCKNVFFLWGNHDKKGRDNPLFHKLWTKAADILHVTILGTELVLCHYAMRVWDKHHYGSIHCYGHSHGSLPELANSRSMDVGVDMAAKFFAKDGVLIPENYRPFAWDEVLEHMKTKAFQPIDHHKGNHQ